MKIRFASGALAVALFVFAGSASAMCPKSAKCGEKKATTVADKDAKDVKADAKSNEQVAGDKAGKKPGCCSKKNASLTADGKAAKKPGCCNKKKVSLTADGSPKKCKLTGKPLVNGDEGCPIAKKVEAILTSLPTMTYRVGDETTGCAKSAAEMAEKAGKPLQYVVGEKTFEKEGEAVAKLTSLLEEELKAMQSVQYSVGGECSRCPVTAKSMAKKAGSKMMYRVAGVDFAEKEDADKTVKLVSEAVTKVKMAYKVDGKTFHCDKAAGAKCNKSGKKMTYVVGEEETPCQTSAKRMQAEAKIRKAVETAAFQSMAS